MMATTQDPSDAVSLTPTPPPFPPLPLLFLDSRRLCREAVTMFYESLPTPAVDIENNSERQHRQWGKAFARLVRREFLRKGKHLDECKQLLETITLINGLHQPAFSPTFRVDFIQRRTQSFLFVPIINDGSAKSKHLRYYKWIYQGMKEADRLDALALADDGGDGRGDGSNDSRDDTSAARDLSHLPKSLTSRSYCAHCYWEGPLSLYCKGCAIKTGSHLTITTRYCSASCRELDRQRHQQRCELRRRFARATHMMKSLHILLEQTNTTLSIHNTFETGGMLFLTEKYQHVEALQGRCAVHPLAASGFETAEHVMAALQDEYSSTLSVTLLSRGQALWLWIGAGLVKDIFEYIVQVKNAHRPIVRLTEHFGTPSNMLRPHIVYRVVLKTGEHIAVDFSGGRYGWAETMMHWDHFEQHRLARCISKGRLRVHSLKPPYLLMAAKSQIHFDLMDLIYEHVGGMLKSAMKSDTDFLKVADTQEYARLEAAIMGEARKVCQLKIPGAAKKIGLSCYRMYLAPFEERVTCRPIDHRRFFALWMTRRQIERELAENEMDEDYRQDYCVLWEMALDDAGIRVPIKAPFSEEVRSGGNVFVADADDDSDTTEISSGLITEFTNLDVD
ncbi:hypothetical protein F5Y04DRAFT_286745 [Hypomontagnella monticulosa]|nr:hypothetical protein F5Y04DRAFT_286745 [Hypomontagnella monticulosa]